MKKIEKMAGIAIALIGAFGGLAGLWGAYTAHDAAKFKEPFFRHEKIAKSFHSQIESAEKRKDNEEVARVRITYEQFEESWRASKKLTALVFPIDSLASFTLPRANIDQIRQLVASIEKQPGLAEHQERILGSAHLVLGEYKEALRRYNIAEKTSQNEADIYTLQAAAYAGLADEESNPQKRDEAHRQAVKLIELAASVKKNMGKLTEYLKENDRLRDIVAVGNTELTNLLTQPQ